MRTAQSTSTSPPYVEQVKMFAAIARGECPGWEGDRVANSDSYAFRVGAESDDASEIVRSIGINEQEYSVLSGLPLGSLRRMSAQIKRGITSRSARS